MLQPIPPDEDQLGTIAFKSEKETVNLKEFSRFLAAVNYSYFNAVVFCNSSPATIPWLGSTHYRWDQVYRISDGSKSLRSLMSLENPSLTADAGASDKG